MRETLPRPVFEKLLATIQKGDRLDGKIAESGGSELADRLENEGYDRFVKVEA